MSSVFYMLCFIKRKSTRRMLSTFPFHRWGNWGTEELMKLLIILFRVPWTARRPNQSILKEISPGCSLEGLMLKLKVQYFGHLMQRADSWEKTLMLGGIEGRRRRGRQRVRWLDGITDRWAWVWVNAGSWWWTGRPGVQRDGVEREAGVGIGMGNTRKSMADLCQCMAKSTTIL